jgi:hypothetical protein
MVTENDIRTRAYFHFENRTGNRWQDPDSNWSQAEAEERAGSRKSLGHQRRTLHISTPILWPPFRAPCDLGQ